MLEAIGQEKGVDPAGIEIWFADEACEAGPMSSNQREPVLTLYWDIGGEAFVSLVC